MSDLTGTWLGTYWQQGKPTRFEATLVQSGNTLTGNILDDSYLGEATLDGEVVGRSVSFVKRYTALKRKRTPVNYQGTVSEDGDYMQGTWDFFGKWGFCPWEAHRRRENLMVELKHRLEQKLPVTSGTARAKITLDPNSDTTGGAT